MSVVDFLFAYILMTNRQTVRQKNCFPFELLLLVLTAILYYTHFNLVFSDNFKISRQNFDFGSTAFLTQFHFAKAAKDEKALNIHPKNLNADQPIRLIPFKINRAGLIISETDNDKSFIM